MFKPNALSLKQNVLALIIGTFSFLTAFAENEPPAKLIQHAESIIQLAEAQRKELKQQLAQLEQDAKQEAPEQAVSPVQWQKAQTDLRLIEGYIQLQKTQLIPALQKNHFTVALNNAASLTRYQGHSSALPQPIMDAHMKFVKEISAHAQAQLEQTKKEVAAFEDKISKLLLTARDPSELDSAIKEIADWQGKLTNQNNTPHRSLRDQLSHMSNIVTAWQDYLGYLKTSNRDRARSSLSQIKRSVVKTPIVNRSTILELENKLEGHISKTVNAPSTLSLAEIIKRYPKIADLKKVEEKSAILIQNKNSNYAAQKIHLVAKKLQEIDHLIDTGSTALAIARLNSLNKPSEAERWFTEITNALRHRIFLNTIPEKLHAKVADMTIEQSIEAVAKHYNEQQQWYELWEFLKFTQDALFNRNSSYLRGFVWFGNDLKSTEAYLGARNLERAGEYYTALTSYRSILKNSGRYGPYRETQQAIQNLRKTKGKEIAEAEKKWQK
ncbi:MAG: hypothetical protein P8P36_03640 [Akkermansiaceae bacterium]|nr:hypothetical protein [Akkermansiaceae bacterium]